MSFGGKPYSSSGSIDTPTGNLRVTPAGFYLIDCEWLESLKAVATDCNSTIVIGPRNPGRRSLFQKLIPLPAETNNTMKSRAHINLFLALPQKSETRGSSPTVKEGSSVFSSESEPSFTVGLLPRALLPTFEAKRLFIAVHLAVSADFSLTRQAEMACLVRWQIDGRMAWISTR